MAFFDEESSETHSHCQLNFTPVRVYTTANFDCPALELSCTGARWDEPVYARNSLLGEFAALRSCTDYTRIRSKQEACKKLKRLQGNKMGVHVLLDLLDCRRASSITLHAHIVHMHMFHSEALSS